jgi:hypothetical protein
LKTLKGFKGSKIPSLDGSIVEFFIAFYDILGNDILEMVEESRKKGWVFGASDATFISLIHKSNTPNYFGGYRPIVLSNLVYKIINKIITSIIKSYLSFGISKEQFGFLEGRKTTSAIGVV